MDDETLHDNFKTLGNVCTTLDDRIDDVYEKLAVMKSEMNLLKAEYLAITRRLNVLLGGEG